MGSSSRELLRAARLYRVAVLCLMAGALAADTARSAPAAARGATSDPAAASRRLREHTLAPLPRTEAGITREAGALVILEHDGSDYSRLEADGTPNYAARARVTRAFYEDHGDLYDFVAVFTNFPFDTAGAVGFHNLVRNDVSGIGLAAINNGPLFGSPGRLKGYVDMGPIEQYRGPPFSTDPSAPGFREAVDVLAHEIGHQWLARVRYRDAGGAASADLLGLDQSHWSYLLDSDASFFYGSDWLPAGEGVYRASRVQQAYSSLDLYLMGLLDPARVTPFTLLRNPAVSPNQPPDEGATVTATPETISIAQVIAAEGARQPDHRASQKDFRVGFIVLAAPGLEPSSEDLEAIDRLREAFSARFFALTRGVAFADTTLAEEPLPPPSPAADLDRALAWLRTRQSLDGRWEDAPGSALRDTAAALAALDAAGDTSTTYAHGQSWTQAANASSVDFLARRASALALEPLTPALRNDLLAAIDAQRNPDGGFGAARGYESDALDTALALRALHDLGSPPNGAVHGALLALGALRLPTGGWELVPGRGASSLATSHVVLALQDWIELPEASSLAAAAVADLAGRQNPDGGFGESPSTAHGTAQALLALDRAGAPPPIVEGATAWLQRSQLPEGSWRGRSYETALALAALKGRTAPNLVVRQDDLVVEPAHPEEGQVVQVTVRVRNVGRLPSPSALVRLFDGAPLADNAIDDATVTAIGPGEDGVVTLEFPTVDRPGTHLLSVKADADSLVAEVREDDNTASRSVEVDGPMADLAIRMSDITVSPYPPEAGETVQVGVTVVNRGSRAAGPTQLRLFRGHPAASGSPIGQATVAPLAPGASAAVSFDWLASGPPGSAQLAAVADATFAVVESDETNNVAAVPVTITGPIGPGADLEIPLLELDPTTLATLPQSASARIVVRNLGRDPASSTVALFEGAPSAGVLLAERPVTLAPRASTVLLVPFEVTTSGTRTLHAVADRAALLMETREDNNQAAAVLTDPRNTLDVSVATASPSASDLVVGETVTVTATIRNRGTMPIAEVPVILARADGGLAELDRERVSLPPGSAAILTLTWTASVTGDAVALAVVADPFDLLLERDESDNRIDFAVRIRPSPLANLHVSGADVTFAPDPPLQGGAATIRARVTNPSPVAVGPFVVRFHLGDPADGGSELGEALVPGVAGQGEALAQVSWSPVNASGALGVFVVVDAAFQVEEYDEGDNVAFRPFQAIGLPDLSVSSAELTFDPAFPRLGDDVTVRAVVRNLGQRAAPPSTLRIFDGDPSAGIVLAELLVPELTPGQSTAMSFVWTPDVEGARSVAALADAGESIPEADEGNNLGRRDVVVQDADFYTSASYFSPDGDGVQDETVLAYRATAGAVRVLVSDARGHRVRMLAENAPAQGAVAWDGRDERGRLQADGIYALTLEASSGAVLGRLDVVLDTNRSAIHDAAGTGLVALRTIDASQTNVRGLAWMPAEDEVLLIVPVDQPLAGLSQGLLRWRLDGARSYVVQDGWYDGETRFASADAVAPDGREVLIVKQGDVFAVDLHTGTRRLIAPGSRSLWSPDASRILVGSDVHGRDGTLLATLPFAQGSWSPDGLDLVEGRELVHRDGTGSRQIPMPSEITEGGQVGEACFRGSSWRGDGRIALGFGHWVETQQETVVFICAPDRVFVHDPETGESTEAIGLRGLPQSDQWSPDGSRLLHRGSASLVSDVTREHQGPSLRIWPSEVWATPRRTAAFFCVGGPEICSPHVARLSVLTNLLNLTADLTPTPLPGNNGILVKGTSTDANLDRWQVEYASPADPSEWHPIGAASPAPVVDGLLATWVPPAPGTYLLRLAAWDRAGGQRTATRVVSWSQTPPLANLTPTERLISPNDDGIKDSVRFDFLVQEPTRLEVRIEGPEPDSGTPGQAPIVRQYSLDLPTIGPGHLIWDGRDTVGQRVPDGRYTVFLNQLPVPVEVDATPPELGFRHDNLRASSPELMVSPDELLGPSGECAPLDVRVQAPALDRHWHVVDPHLKRWSHGIHEWGTGQVYEPERDAAGAIVYIDGVPKVARIDGRPVDKTGLVAAPNWPGTIEAEDFGGNVSVLSSPAIAKRVFVVGLRPQPRCLPPGSALPPTRYLDGERVKLTPRTRFFVKTAPNAPDTIKRFQFRASATDSWSSGPASSLEREDIVDVDLGALGLEPGRTYLGRFVDSGPAGATSDEFEFEVCTESVTLRLDPPQEVPGTGQSRYVVNLEANVSTPLSSAGLSLTGEGALAGFHLATPFERTGPTSYRKVVIAPTAGCSPSGEPAVLEFQAFVHGATGTSLPHDGACLNLIARAGRCANGLLITEEVQPCGVASPDRVVLKVEASSPDPASSVVLERIDADGDPVTVGQPYVVGSGDSCGSVPTPTGPQPLFCDRRFVIADVGGVPDGGARFVGRLDRPAQPPDEPPLAAAEREIRIDHTAPTITMPEPPSGGAACVERDGLIETARLSLRVEDAASTVDVIDASYRYGSGPWHPMCLDLGCGPWAELPTHTTVPQAWDVRGLADGSYEIRLELCDGSGNRTVWTRLVSISRAGTAIDVEPSANQDFSPNGDGRAEQAVVSVRLPQTLHLGVEARAGAASGAVVRHLADQQLGAGSHVFEWDGRTDDGSMAPNARYVIVGNATNACGGTAAASTWVQLDTVPPVAEIASPLPGALVQTTTSVEGRAQDARFASYALSFGTGSAPASWTPIAAAPNPVGIGTFPGTLGAFQPPPAEGSYTLRLIARDRALNETETRTVVNVGPRAFLERLSVTPDAVSPNGDGRRETATIEYELRIAGRVTLEVRDEADVLLRRLESSVDHPPGTYTQTWNGTMDSGGPAPEGRHRVVVHVADPAGIAAPQDQWAGLLLDRTAPSVSLSHPLPAAFVAPDDAVRGSIADPNLREYVVRAERPFGGGVELARGTQSQSDAELAAMTALSDGPYELVITAEDAAENRTERRASITVDAVLPQALLTSPAPGAVVARGTAPIAIVGTALDAHLETYRLEFGAGTAPGYFVPIATGSQAVASGPLGSWAVAGLAEGPYVLRLEVRDRAGRSAESRATIVLDVDAPDARIAVPAAGAALNLPATVQGTATDSNLASWRLEAAPGEAATAFQWSLLAESGAPVVEGSLGEWAPLPPDGAHTLRLTVSDRAGRESIATRSVTIDTQPPAMPAGVVSELLPSGGTTADVTLTWASSVEPDLAGYRIARDGLVLGSELLALARFTDEDRPEGVYRYEVRAVDRAGNASPPRDHRVTIDLTPPTVAFLDPAAGASVSGAVDVRGTAFSADDFGELRLLAGEGASPTVWTLVRRSTVPVSAGLLGTWTPTQAGAHLLALEAEDRAGNQARVTVGVTVDHAPPAAPVLLSVQNVPVPTTLTSTWQPVGDTDVAGYLPYRNGRLANAPAVVIGDLRPYLVPGPTYADTLLPDGLQCYRIVAMDQAGNVSPPSNEICAPLDNRPPHALLVEPPDGTRFEFPIRLVATSPDLDVASVRFERTPAGQTDWTPIAPPDTQPPFEATLDPIVLSPGAHRIRAVAAEAGGELDPAPEAITVTYGDATPPAPPSGLAVHVDGGVATLGWTAGTEPDLSGYHVYRDGVRLTPAPQAATTFTESLGPGAYVYGVTALDTDGNESLPASADALVYRLTLDAIVPAVTDGPVTLTGAGGRSVGGTVEIVRSGETVGQAPLDSSGRFTVAAVPLAPGANVLTARERAPSGHASLESDDVVAIANTAPGPVTGLAPSVSGLQVTLHWDATSDPEVFGYGVRRDGEELTARIAQTSAANIVASSSLESYGAGSAFDGELQTAWIPQTFEAASDWTIEFSDPILVGHVSLDFGGFAGPVPAPAHRLEAEWEGRFLPLLASPAGPQSHVEHTLALPFATRRLRVSLAPATCIGLAEVAVERLDLVPAATPIFVETVPDGRYTYEVSAVDRYGARGPASPTEALVGDVEAPPAPEGLAAGANGSEVSLTWLPVQAPDLADYVVRRDGVNVGTSVAPTFVDANRPNGTYSYTVRARDAVGNQSADSQPAVASVATQAPTAPVLSAVAPPSGGVLSSWTHPGAARFVIRRGVASGGPYEAVAETGDVRQHLDLLTRPGAAYYYVVQAFDAAGNASPDSNEATATAVAPPPVLSRPTDAGHPVTLRGPRATFAGRAWRDAVIALTVDGELRGVTEAGRAFEESESLSVPEGGFAPRVSPDGRTLSFAVSAADAPRARWVEWATGTVDGIETGSAPVAFSPDGRRLAFAAILCDESGCRSDLKTIDLDTRVTSSLGSDPLEASDAAWSPSGDRIAAVTVDPQSLHSQLVEILVGSGARRVVADFAEAIASPRWAPGSEEIAIQRWDEASQQLVLDVVDVHDGSVRSLDDAVGWSSPAWAPAGRTIVYTSVSSERPRLRSWNLATGTLTDLTDGTRSAVDPRIDPTGEWLSYVRFEQGEPVPHALVVRRLATGTERDVLTWTSEFASASDVHEWVRGGYLAVLAAGRVSLFPAFDGAFQVPSVALAPGVNRVEAEGIEVSTGAVSESSAPVLVTAPPALFSDLLVTPADLSAYPTIPTIGQASMLSARVRNAGPALAGPSRLQLTLRGPAGVLIEETVAAGAIEPGGQALASVPWTPSAPGTYLWSVEADADQEVPEGQEDNNAADLGIFVVAAGGLEVGLDADRDAYPAHTPALVRVEVVNGGPPFEGTLITRVVAPSGTPVATIDERALTLSFGQSRRIDLAWDTGTTRAGDYVFEVRALRNELSEAGATRAFRIDPDIAVWARVVPEDPTVIEGETVVLRARVENRGANAVVSEAVARVEIVPAAGGPAALTSSAVVPSLEPGAAWEAAFTWPSAGPAGAFVASLEVSTPAGIVASGTAPIEVSSSASPLLTGTLALDPEHVLHGAPAHALATVVNEGPAPVVQACALEVSTGPSPAVVLHIPFVLDIPAGGTRQVVLDVPTGTLAPGLHLVFLRCDGSSASLDRRTLRVHSTITPPSVDTPPDGGRVDTDHPELRVNNASATGASLLYEFQVFRDAALTLPLPGASGVPEGPLRTSWRVQAPLTENEIYFWRARATDGFSASAWTTIASFRVDAVNEPPSAPTPDAPGPDARVATLQPALVVANASDPELDPLTYDFRLASDAAMSQIVASVSGVAPGAWHTSWSVPAPLTENERYYWSARARDTAGSSAWTVPIAFRVDVQNESPSAVPLLRPDDDAEVPTLAPELAVASASDPEGDALAYRIEVDRVGTFDSIHKQASPDLVIVGGEAAWTPPGPLLDNALGYWRARASDGNTAGPWSSRTLFVNLANDPPAAPVPLDPGAGTVATTQTPTLRVQNAVDVDRDTLTYSFEVRDSDGAILASATSVPEAPSQTSWLVAETLAENGTFVWRARAHDGETFGPWTPDVPFRVNSTDDPPTAPTLSAPSEGSILAIRRPDLVVANAVSPDLLPLTYAFELYRLETGGGTSLVASIAGVPSGSTQTAWALAEDLANAEYGWRARAVDVHQPGPWMSTARFTVAANLAPAAPTGLTALAGDERIDLSWNAHPEPDVVGYRVYRASAPGGPHVLVGSSATPTLADTGLPNGHTVYYVVTAVDDSLESPPSEEVAATPTAGPVTADVAFWPAVLDGECLQCDLPEEERSRDLVARVSHVVPVLECIRNDGPLGFRAFFGFDNPNAASTPIPIGEQNAFDPPPIDRGQPTLFARGRSAEYPGLFGVALDENPLTWWLDGQGVTAHRTDAVKNCPLPVLACPRWLYATIEPAAGHDPASIDPISVRLAGVVAADPAYQALVDRDGDGLMEREVRFALAEVRPLLAPGTVPLGVSGALGALAFVGGGQAHVAPPKARLEAWPTVFRRSHEGPDLRAWITLRGCFGGAAVDVASIRLNGRVPVLSVLGIEGGVLMVTFDRAAVLAVLPLGTQDVAVTGTALGQPFRSVDRVRIEE